MSNWNETIKKIVEEKKGETFAEHYDCLSSPTVEELDNMPEEKAEIKKINCISCSHYQGEGRCFFMRNPRIINPKNYECKDYKGNKELHPNHYSGLYECWVIMKYLLGRKPFFTPFQGYLYGCSFKYSWRMGEKKNVDIIQDIDKQINYLTKLKEDILSEREKK